MDEGDYEDRSNGFITVKMNRWRRLMTLAFIALIVCTIAVAILTATLLMFPSKSKCCDRGLNHNNSFDALHSNLTMSDFFTENDTTTELLTSKYSAAKRLPTSSSEEIDEFRVTSGTRRLSTSHEADLNRSSTVEVHGEKSNVTHSDIGLKVTLVTSQPQSANITGNASVNTALPVEANAVSSKKPRIESSSDGRKEIRTTATNTNTVSSTYITRTTRPSHPILTTSTAIPYSAFSTARTRSFATSPRSTNGITPNTTETKAPHEFKITLEIPSEPETSTFKSMANTVRKDERRAKSTPTTTTITKPYLPSLPPWWYNRRRHHRLQDLIRQRQRFPTTATVNKTKSAIKSTPLTTPFRDRLSASTSKPTRTTRPKATHTPVSRAPLRMTTQRSMWSKFMEKIQQVLRAKGTLVNHQDV